MSAVTPSSRQRIAWWALVALISVAVGAAAIKRVAPIVIGTLGGSPAESTEGHDDPGLPGHAVPILRSPHIPVGRASTVQYNSTPPTSGPHFTVSPAPGVYDSPLPNGLQIHALEHGHVGIQYATDVSASTIDALRRIGARYPRDVFVAPDPEIAHGIALTAWGRIDLLDEFDYDRISQFIVALSGRYDHGWRTAGGSRSEAAGERSCCCSGAVPRPIAATGVGTCN